MVQYMDEHGMAPACLKDRDWKTYNHNLLTQAEVDEMQSAFTAFFATKTMAELYEAALERKLMLAPINDPSAIVASHQLGFRNFFTDLEYPHLGGRLRHPGAIAKLRPDGLRGPFRAPRIGEHNRDVYGEIGLDENALTELRTEGVI
jgi:crotonobetainyl-CoA:carnitine CoA-transferase CaiB-like acyl-CoA transferase